MADESTDKESNPPSKRSQANTNESHRARGRASLDWALDAWGNTLKRLSK